MSVNEFLPIYCICTFPGGFVQKCTCTITTNESCINKQITYSISKRVKDLLCIMVRFK